MATVKLGHTGSSSRLISYCEKRAVEKEGLECSVDIAKTQFKATQNIHGKPGGVQAYHIIQSFKPGEIKPDQANQVGQDLARKISKGHEAVIYTHSDKKHIHNHIVINAVHAETGRKFQLHGKQAIDRVRQASDEVCRERGLSIVKEPIARLRYTLAERSVIEKGQESWKDYLRQVIDLEKANSKDYDEFKRNLQEKYSVEVKERGKHITYKHPDHQRTVRGNKLGLDYERGTIVDGFNRPIERGQTRGNDCKSNEFSTRDHRAPEGDQRTKPDYAELHQGPHERGYAEESDHGCRTGQHEKDQRRDSNKPVRDQHGDTKEDGLDLSEARRHAESLRRQSATGYKRFKERDQRKQQKDLESNDRDRKPSKEEHEHSGREQPKNRERFKDRSLGHGR